MFDLSAIDSILALFKDFRLAVGEFLSQLPEEELIRLNFAFEEDLRIIEQCRESIFFSQHKYVDDSFL